MMEFYAQELWIFLIYNVRGSLLSCLPPPPGGPSPTRTRPLFSVLAPLCLCSTSCHRDHSGLAPPGSCQALGLCGQERLVTYVCKPSRSVGPGASSPCPQSQLVLVPSPALGPAHRPCSALTSSRPSFGSHRSKVQLPVLGWFKGMGGCERTSSRKIYKLLLVLRSDTFYT